MQNTFTIDADIKKTSYFNQPTVTSHDDITFIVNIFDDGQAFDLTTVTTVTLANTRPDAQTILTLGDKTGLNQVTFNLGTNETVISGRVEAVVQLYDVNGRVSTLAFSYAVKTDPVGDGYVPSESEQSLIDIVLNDGPLRIQEAVDAGIYANLQGDYALAQGDIASVESSNLSTLKTDVQTATTDANTATINANDSAIYADTQGDYALAQGDYAKTEADRLVGTDVSTLDVRVTDNTAQLAQTMNGMKSVNNNLFSLNYLVDVNLGEIVFENAETPITIPTYVATNNEVVHPSILFFPNNWNGYKYWMGLTPFTEGNSAYENPSIAASHDGVTWVVPTGVVNPIEPAPAAGFHADINLIADPDGITVHMIWKYSAGSNITYLRSSTNAADWTTKKIILDTPLASDIVASPKILYDDDKYTLWYVNTALDPNVLTRRTCATIDGVYSLPIACTLTGLPVGREIWHFDINKVGSQYHMIINDTINGASGAGGELYLGKSNDGINWVSTTTPIMKRGTGLWDSNLYKATMLPILINGEMAYRVWYGVGSGLQGQLWAVGIGLLTFNKTKVRQAYLSKINQAINLLDKHIFCDTFNRTEGTDVITSSSGGTWVNNTNVGLKISNKKAVIKTAGNTISLFNTGVANYKVSFEIHEITKTIMLHVRSKNGTSYIRFGATANSPTSEYQLTKYDGTTVTTIVSTIGAPAIGDKITVVCVGDSIECYVNDALRCQTTDALNNDGTFVGVQMSDVAAMIDNFIVETI